MNLLARADRFACQLSAPVRDYFIGVRVGARARAGLKNVEREMVVEFSLSDFLGCLRDQGRALCVQQSEIMVSLRGSPFDQAERANEWPRKSVATHRKIHHGAVRGGTVKRIRGHGHLAHRIFFDSRRFFRHAERSAPTPANRERLFDFVDTRPSP